MDLERLNIAVEPMMVRRELGIDERARVVGMVARVRGKNVVKKGHKYFLQACAEVVRAAPRVRFIVAGEDDEAREYLQGMADGLGLSKAVIFLGYRVDILQVMSAFDVIVLASLFEGLPRTLMEGMALGKPAVGTNVDGIGELIVNDECGVLVDPENPHQLAEAITELLNNERKGKEMGLAARARIAEHFDAKKMAEETGAVYEELTRV